MVSAGSPAANRQSVAGGSWDTGTEVIIDLAKTPAPFDWFQLLANGVKITEPGKICHPFSGGQFGWKAEIRQLVAGNWVKVPTTLGWVPSEEGAYTACAQAPSAGTYALFGYYPKGLPVKASCPYNTSEWEADTYDSRFEVNLSNDVPEGLTGSFVVLSSSGMSLELSDLSGSDVTYNDGSMYITFYGSDLVADPGFSATIRFTLGSCTLDLEVDTSGYGD